MGGSGAERSTTADPRAVWSPTSARGHPRRGGPVLRSRRAWLERPGLTAEAEELEELVVIRAQYR
ncbi:hypothetical protein GCM10020254_80220 [Streptomyces goshikiensis]